MNKGIDSSQVRSDCLLGKRGGLTLSERLGASGDSLTDLAAMRITTLHRKDSFPEPGLLTAL
ncbi:hypothetical protein D3C81_2127890 [compost metagenome]